MRRVVFLALCCLVLAACTRSAGGAFGDLGPTASPTTGRPAHLDSAALTALRDRLVGALFPGRVSDGHLALTWGGGPAYDLGGPYDATQPGADALAVLAATGLPAGSPGAAARPALAAGATAGLHQLQGPAGTAYLLLARAAGLAAGAGSGLPAEVTPAACASPAPGDDPGCLRRQVSDGLLAAYYARDSKTFFHVGDATTVYRPVDAFAVGAALVVAGYAEHNYQKIDAGTDIVNKEMAADFDPHFGLAYGLMSASAAGGRRAIDTNGRMADQAGIANALLDAFDASRDHVFQEYAATALKPFTDDLVALRGPDGYVSGFDLRGAGPDHAAVDVEAAALVLQAAHHYDRDDGNHFAAVEEDAAAALLGAAARVETAGGLPGALIDGTPSVRSGVVTAAAIVALTDALR